MLLIIVTYYQASTGHFVYHWSHGMYLAKSQNKTACSANIRSKKQADIEGISCKPLDKATRIHNGVSGTRTDNLQSGKYYFSGGAKLLEEHLMVFMFFFHKSISSRCRQRRKIRDAVDIPHGGYTAIIVFGLQFDIH